MIMLLLVQIMKQDIVANQPVIVDQSRDAINKLGAVESCHASCRWVVHVMMTLVAEDVAS